MSSNVAACQTLPIRTHRVQPQQNPPKPSGKNNSKKFPKASSTAQKPQKGKACYSEKAKGFLDLPGELRNEIYEMALAFDKPIELCPEPWKYVGGSVGDDRASHSWYDKYKRAVEYHDAYMRTNSAIGLLSTSKQISREASPYLYSENEFRFTNSNGWIILDHFLYTIGLEKCKMLRKVTVCHPDFSVLPSSKTSDGNGFREGSIGIYALPIREDGFSYSDRWFESPMTKDPTLVLEKVPELEHLRIIIPMERSLVDQQEGRVRALVDQQKFKDLKITLGVIRARRGPMAERFTEAQAMEKATEMAQPGWEKEVCSVSKYGRY